MIAILPLVFAIAAGHVPATAPDAYVWQCHTDSECEQEYFHRFGQWPDDADIPSPSDYQ